MTNSDAWESIYREKGEHFKDIHEAIPRLEETFKKYNLEKILDLGCGTGRHVVYFAEKGFKVYGFDISTTGIDFANRKLKERNLTADLRVWDMRKPLPYNNEFFDAIISIRVLGHGDIKTIKGIISEVERVLKPKGYVFADMPTYEKVLRLIQQGEEFKEIEERTYEPLSGPEKGLLHHNFTREEALELFRNFDVIEFYEKDEHYNLLGRKK